ncbi:MAG: DUF2905 domain-containing protein [Bacillota bacterium]|jgi:hypothetical protein
MGTDLGRFLIVVGLFILAMGLFVYGVGRFLPLGRLPGDIVVRRGNFTFYFPLVTCIIISLVVTLIMWVYRRP